MVLLLGNPGDEVALLNGMIGTILGEGWEDKGYIEERTEGIEALREKQTGYSNLFDGEKKAELERAARIYAQSKKAMILIGSGLWSHINQKELAIASSNLSLITGHIGKESCGILVLLEKCNSQGAIDLGIFSGAVADGKMDLLQKAAEGKLKALYLVGEDPSTLSSDRFEKAMDSLRFLVVQDLFMTETAKKAHVVLPACAFVEKQGTFTNLERRIQRLSPLRPPLGQSKSDFEIFLQLLHILESPVSGETPEAIFEAIRLSVPYYKDVQKEGQWPDGLPYLYAEGFPKGKAKLIPLAQPQPKPQADNYPLFLIQRPSLFQSGLLSLKSDTLKIVAEKPCLEMNIEDARRLHIEEGETIQISTQEGQALRMKVNCSSKLGSGVITIPFPCPVIDKTGRTPVKVERLKGK
jgi:predicted molibdopterin-dependent oxidoreductase YjgC